MRRLLTGYKISLAIIAFSWVLWVQPGYAADAARIPVPQPVGYVNDFANVLPADAEARLNAISVSLEQATTVQMVFVILPTVEPYESFGYSMALFDQWKIGQRGKDNGLLILLTLKERKIEIRTGYGVESILPDGKVGRYRDMYLIPYLKQNQLDAGLANLGLAFAQDIAQEMGVPLQGVGQQKPKGQKKTDSTTLIIALLIALVAIRIIFRSSRRGLHTGYLGGGISSGYFRSGGGGFGGGFSGFGGGFSGGGGASGSW